MSAYKLEKILDEDGKVVLENLPFQAGDRIEIIVLGEPKEHLKTNTQLEVNAWKDFILTREEFSQSVNDFDYLTAISETMNEWNSEEDNLAYADL